MCVFEYDQYRSHLCQTFQAPDQHVEGLLFQTLRAEIEFGIAVTKRDREHGRKQRRILWRKTTGRHGRLQLAEPILRCVRASESDLTLPSGNDRKQRVVLMIRRAEIPQVVMSLSGKSLLQRGQQTRLADPCLTGQEHHATIARDRLPPLTQQEFQLLVAAHDRCLRAGEERLRPTGKRGLPVHAPDPLNRAEAFQVDRPEVLHFEQRAGLRMRGITHHNRVGRRERLQPGGQMHGFADRHQLPCRAGTHEVTDQHKAARDADTYRQLLRKSCIDDRQARPDGALGMRLVGIGPAEIDQQAIADDASDITPGCGHRGGDVQLKRAEKVTHLLGVELGRERRRADNVAEQNGYLASLRRCARLRLSPGLS